ncbi:coniferyl alcohol acyltransferase-like [Corylus avellana]|uniref:coniferyl alcohol acyltransferase-like n=1 Tax=Corylus avellana TaxID=13451 RepID=UPI00286AE590|nr:coniferyl alcohol acyltransferase-like [Corylus avellana]
MGEGGGGAQFIVNVSKREVVAVVLPLQGHWLPLSNRDLLLPPVDVGVFFVSIKTCATSGEVVHNSVGEPEILCNNRGVSVLKKALAQVLVSHYVFAGEVVHNSVGEPKILCNNRGVDFVEAFAEVERRDINLYNPDDTIEGKLVPEKKHGVFAVQATGLRCGGLVVACSFDHRVADAYSANMFLVSWAELALSKPISTSPSFRPSLLNPRRPGSIHPSLDDMYVPVTKLPPPKHPEPDYDHLISRIYYITAEQLSRLQSLASTKGCRRTKLESFSAFLWKMVAKLAVTQNADKKITKMGVVVDGRTRLTDGDEHKASLLGSYFGNVLSTRVQLDMHQLDIQET